MHLSPYENFHLSYKRMKLVSLPRRSVKQYSPFLILLPNAANTLPDTTLPCSSALSHCNTIAYLYEEIQYTNIDRQSVFPQRIAKLEATRTLFAFCLEKHFSNKKTTWQKAWNCIILLKVCGKKFSQETLFYIYLFICLF